MKPAFQCLLWAFIVLPNLVVAQTAYARKGFLDLRTYTFEQGPVQLSGEWEFYSTELLSPQHFKRELKPVRDYVDFPSTWNNVSKSRKPGDGYATYLLSVAIHSPCSLALEIPHFYSSYKLWINGRPSAANGKVGNTESTSIPQWLPKTITFHASTDTLTIVIQVSNFHHAKGGVREPLLLGRIEDLAFKRHVAIVSNLGLFICLALIAIIFIFCYWVVFLKKERSMLYFAALCLTWSIRSVFSNLYLVTSFFPDFPWEISVKIEYITLYLMMIWTTLFLTSIFRNDVSLAFKYLFCLCNTIFVALTISFKASLYTQFLQVYLSFCFMLLIYVVYVLVRAVVYEREGVWLIVTSMFLGVIIFAYDLISFQGFAVFNPVIINLGYICMFILMAACLLIQAGFLKRSMHQSNILTYDELYGTKNTKA